MKTAEQTTATIPSVDATVATMASESTALALALATVAENSNRLAEKDAAIEALNGRLELAMQDLFAVKEQLRDAQRTQAKVTLSHYGDMSVVNMDEALEAVKTELKNKNEREINSLKTELAALKQALANEKVRNQEMVNGHNAERLRAELVFRADSSNIKTRHENEVLDLKEENTKLTRQIERLSEGQQFSTIEKENLDLKSKLAKANKRFFNWEYFSVN